MAVSGASGWPPSNHAKIKDGKIVFIGYTQNKPKSIVNSLDVAEQKLRAGEVATVDVRFAYMSELRKRLADICPKEPTL